MSRFLVRINPCMPLTDKLISARTARIAVKMQALELPLPDSSLFKAYDIRGIVDRTLTESAVRAIGLALGSLALESAVSRIAVGRDGRLSGPALRDALIDGIVSTGIDVVDVGMVPTPVLYFATHHLKTGSG